MDRTTIYPGAIPLETDLLSTNRNVMISLGKLIGAVLGTGNVINGLSVTASSPAALTVSVAAGEMYSLQNVDNTAYSSIAADTTDTCVKQGIQLQPVSLSCPAPGTTGFSINYLIEASFIESDLAPYVLPYYNASNPAQAYSGPANSGVAQATMRACRIQLQAKAGIAATTGSQGTPSVDSGNVALAVVTVAFGQTTIVAGNITTLPSGAVLTSSLLAQILALAPYSAVQFNNSSSVNATTAWVNQVGLQYSPINSGQATAAAYTVPLTAAGARLWFNNTISQTATLPATATLPNGASFHISKVATGGGTTLTLTTNGGIANIDSGNGLVSSIVLNEGEDVVMTWVTGVSTWVVSGSFLFRYLQFTIRQASGSNGYQKLPGGKILQWGSTTLTSTTSTITLPVATPNSVRCVVITANDASLTNAVCVAQIGASLTSFQARSSATVAATWFAVTE